MEYTAAKKAFEELAKREGVTYEEIVQEIEDAIEAAIRNAYRTGNAKAIALWHLIPCEGERPNAFEFMTYMGEKVRWEMIMRSGSHLWE